MFVAMGFIPDLFGALLIVPDMNPNRHMIIDTCLRSFDAFNMIGVS